MQKSVYDKLKELSWQRQLTAKEQAELNAYLALHPEAESDWSHDLALSECLQRLPDVPLASNFTAQVLQAVKLEELRISRVQEQGWAAWRTGFKWVFRSAIAGSLACVGVFACFQYRSVQRVEMARNLEHVSAAATTSKMAWLQDFDAINRMSRVQSPADEELLAALK